MYCENVIDMGRRKKYNTEEERKAARKAYKAEYRAKHKDEITAYMAEYRANHKEELAAKKGEWYQQNKEKIAEYMTEYYQKNKEKKDAYSAEYRAKHKNKIIIKRSEYYQKNKDEIAAKMAEYYQKNKDEIAVKQAEYRSTPFGRAKYLELNYKRLDEENNRGECSINAQWIVDNIFTQPCHYCGETDWHKLGCDRINNSLPHTPDNVVCCCGECNTKKNITPYDEFMRMIGKIGYANKC